MTTATQATPFKATQLGLWLPEPGDSLTQTLSKVYGLKPIERVFQPVLDLHLKLNPEVKNPNLPLRQSFIYLADLQFVHTTVTESTTQLMNRLNHDKTILASSKSNLEAHAPKSTAEAEAMRFILGFNSLFSNISSGLGIAGGTASTLSGRHLQTDILQFNKWAADKAALTQSGMGKDLLHHYDARMDDIVKRIQKQLGPTKRFMFNGVPVREALTTGVPQSLRPNPITISAAKRIQQLASGAKAGGAALMLVDAALTCQKLAATPKEQKVETAYNEIGGFGGSVLFGVLTGVAIASMATPVGWLGAIVITAGASVGGKVLGEFTLNTLHSRTGDFLEIKDGKLINSWCK